MFTRSPYLVWLQTHSRGLRSGAWGGFRDYARLLTVGGPVFHFLARDATDIFSVARRLRYYYRNVTIAIIASSGIFISEWGE
jgi:hypothetical protein